MKKPVQAILDGFTSLYSIQMGKIDEISKDSFALTRVQWSRNNSVIDDLNWEFLEII